MAVVTDARPVPRSARARAAAIDSRYRRGPGRWLVLAAAVLVGLAVLAPFGIMLLNAFKSPQD
jgi:raffinose/stachyose/melibiose transport system permease protein